MLIRSGKCSWLCQSPNSARWFGRMFHHMATAALPRSDILIALLRETAWETSGSILRHALSFERGAGGIFEKLERLIAETAADAGIISCRLQFGTKRGRLHVVAFDP